MDGEFSFGIDLDNLVKLNLKVWQEYSESELNEIIKKAEFQQTLDRLLKFATLRPRSEKEIKDWLRRKKVHGSLHNGLFSKLRRLKLLDDEKFTKWWVEQRNHFRPRPKRILNYELRAKGVDRNIIENVLAEFEIDEESIAKELLEKRKYKWTKLEEPIARKKMSQFLVRKGFGWDVIKSVVE